MKKVLQFIFISIVSLLTAGCEKEVQITYEYYSYGDGNGNSYIINKEELEYIPVDPATSSSGFYDGGEYIKIKITESDYGKIITLLNETIADTSIHVKDQIPKGSGRIVVEKNNDIKIIVIEQDSDKQYQIEKLLNNLIYK